MGRERPLGWAVLGKSPLHSPALFILKQGKYVMESRTVRSADLGGRELGIHHGSSLKDGKDMMTSRSDDPPNSMLNSIFLPSCDQKFQIITFEQVLRALSQEEWKAITVAFAFRFMNIHRQCYFHFQQHRKEEWYSLRSKL